METNMLTTEKEKVPKAIGLLSGGLDSVLAARLMKEIGVEVILLHLCHIFHPLNKTAGKTLPEKIAEEQGLPLVEREITEELIEVVVSPQFGRGKNLNPCVDCRIVLLKNAKEEMERQGADFIFTGEVVGQRPMSQHKGAMNRVMKEAGVEDILLRPLCAKILKKTPMEDSGLVDRERLLDISGRSRSRQLALAKQWKIKHFATPAGGCLLTDPTYSRRLQDLFDHEALGRADIENLRVGRHFRLDAETKVVVGRNEADNEIISELAKESDIVFYSTEPPGPAVLLRGDVNDENIRTAALLQKHYCKARLAEKHVVMRRSGKEAEGSPMEVCGSISDAALDSIIVR